MALSDVQIMRYSRHIALKEMGIEGQEKLLNGKVLIIGAGGLGSPVSMYLAAAGVGTLGIVDADCVDLSNLQRQIIHNTEDIGKAKVQSAKEKLISMNPDITIHTYYEMVTADNILDLIEDYDFITYVPKKGPCYRCIFKNPPPEGVVPDCKNAGLVGIIPGIIGSIQAMEAVKYFIGAGDLLIGKLLTFDALKMQFRTIKLPKTDGTCEVCGTSPSITKL